ncbi:hypothetical protein LG52_969 [Geobacillus kaustophilus]|uniref:Uncharacterized protein n=1 Tax=Geobacillus kaustophilus TaxID=1462 RepID=A0A0D8BVD8_GEOKU|nr:hypothetical protein [Geobacillus kaustophilus]KJE28143.1 hypothetical protein LG52_969 [Geobacillus kaustophilus]
MDILNYQKILYINSVVRNKWFVHLVVSRMTGRGRERTEWPAAKRECGFNIQHDASRLIRSAASTIAL